MNSTSRNETENAEGREATPSSADLGDNSSQDTAGDEPAVQVEEIGTTSEPVSADIGSRSDTDTTETLPDTEHSRPNVEVSNEDNTDETIPEVCPVSNDELRERRLNFFSSPSTGKVPSDNQPSDQSSVKCTKSEQINGESISSSEIKPKSLTKLASDLLTEQIPSENSSTDSSVSKNSDSNEQTGSSVDSKEQTDSPSVTGTGSEQQNSGLEPGEIRVRIKFFNDTQRSVTALATETIGNFRR